MQERYNSYKNYIKNKYGERIQKITVHGGFTCPNRDGTKGIGGCTYCNNQSFAAPEKILNWSISDQITHGINQSKKRYPKISKYIIYFQSYSNTYAPLKRLKEVYEEALSYPNVIGISIGTRPDCLPDEVIDYLKEISDRGFDVVVELGMESMLDETLEKINRQHTFNDFVSACFRLSEKKIDICAHWIIGLPNEDCSTWIATAKKISTLPIKFLKIHQLQIIKDTVLAQEYEKHKFKLLTFDEYINILIQVVEHLNWEIVLQRFFAEAPLQMLVAGGWEINISDIPEEFYRRLTQKDTYQGKLSIHS